MKKNPLIILTLSTLLTSCNTNLAYYTHQVLGDYYEDIGYVSPLNTSITLKMFDKDVFDEVIDDFDNIVKDLSKQADRYNNYDNLNNLKVVNDSCGSGNEIIISDDLFDLIDLGIELTKVTEGKFHLAMGSLIDLYEEKFNDENIGTINTLPDVNEINNAINSIPSYTEIENYIILNKENNSIILNKYNDNDIVISLGAIAKGFVMQKAYDYLYAYESPFIFDAGSSTVAMAYDNLMRKNNKWNVGFINPIKENNELLCNISVTGNTFISTSGDYQKYFYYEEDGQTKIMHHILDANTGYCNTFYNSISVVSNNASLAILDATSTALFNCKTNDEAISLVNTINETYDIDISYCLTSLTDNNNLNLVVSSSFDNVATAYSTNIKTKQVID